VILNGLTVTLGLPARESRPVILQTQRKSHAIWMTVD